MFQGVTTLLERSLRTDARTWPTHIFRLAFLLVTYICLAQAQEQARWIGAPGLLFFSMVSYVNAFFIAVAGASFFSQAVTEEKEEDTLGLMLLAGISPLGLLLGKSVGRLAQVALLLAVQYPLMRLSVTLGGVLPNQLAAVYVSLLSFTILLSGVGLFVSVVSQRSRDASFLMGVFLMAYWIVPMIAMAYGYHQARIAGDTPWTLAFKEFGSWCIFFRMNTVLSTGFGESILSGQVISNVAGGLLGFALAWTLFPFFATRVPTESTIGVWMRRRRWFTAPRPWSNPFIWKDYYFSFGGVGGIVWRFGLFAGLFVLCAALTTLDRGRVDLEDAAEVATGFLCLGLVIDAAYCVAHAIAGEVRGQTLSTLMMLPHSPARIIYSKLAGALLGWLPGLALLVVVTLLFERTSRNLGDLLDEEVFFWLVANALCGVHLSALLATFVRWGAVAFGLGTQFLSMFLGVIIMETMIRGSEEEFILFVWTPCLVFLMIGLNVLLVARFQKLAEQG